MPVPLSIPAQVPEIAGESTPAASRPAGYAALIAAFGLQVPAPDVLLTIGEKHTMRQEGRWRILTPRYRPADTISAHLDFALRHEGVDLGTLSALFPVMPKGTIEDWVKSEPTGQHARRIWFLYEWLTAQKLALPDAPKAPYVGALDEKHQFAVRGETVTRYRIRNNLPGTPDFCPLIRRTDHLTAITGTALADEARAVVQRTAPDLMARAAAFLLLEDSKASYVIEGERPPQDRIQRWGQAIGEAGQHPLTTDELLRLQRIVIGNARFMHFGWRTEGGFVGKRDRETNAPIPDHISSRHEDIAALIGGLIAYAERAEKNNGLHAIVAAAAVAFGFVFIHPFEDGNGRIHRWLVHHILSRSGFNPPGIIFPVSAVFLEQIERYRRVLDQYSRPRLLLTRWETTPSLNVRVLNQTRDLFRFFDATSQAEFLADCIVQTIRRTLPNEVEYLRRYDQARQSIGAFLEMPDATFDLMMGFLGQNRGRFSQRARSEEFAELTDEEATAIESIYQDLLLDKATSAKARVSSASPRTSPAARRRKGASPC
ncbi:MAG: Fic family protein [Parvibaculaceae bacterium]